MAMGKLGTATITYHFYKNFGPLSIWYNKKMPHASSFTFGTYKVDTTRSIISFTYHVKFKYGITKTFTDRLIFPDVAPELWEKIPKTVLEPTLQTLLLMIGINYWCVFPTNNIRIE